MRQAALDLASPSSRKVCQLADEIPRRTIRIPQILRQRLPAALGKVSRRKEREKWKKDSLKLKRKLVRGSSPLWSYHKRARHCPRATLRVGTEKKTEKFRSLGVAPHRHPTQRSL
mmetsp:Transcript_17774/g.54322  ORF Transcript_17774/g.54322 Transcript_17774/m.54322 type:complete len:115 (-) Transcript_17774:357-701(-)